MVNSSFDPEKDKKVNDWLANTMAKPDEGDKWMALPESVRNEGPVDSETTAFDTDKTSNKNDQEMENVVSSHPGHQPEDLDKYLQGQEEQSNKWGPDKEAAVMQNISDGYRKPGYIASEGLAGLGDAIMQGVARAGSGNFLNTVEHNKENAIKNTSDQLSHLQEGNLRQMGVKQGLAGMTSTSALGKSYIDSLKPLAQKLFPQMTEEVWASISRNPKALKEMMGPAIDMEKVEGELAMRDATLGVQSENYRAQRRAEEERLRTEREKGRADAAKTLGGRGLWRRTVDAVTGNEATKVLENQMKGGDDFETHVASLPSGSTYKAPDGTTRRKK